MTEGGKAARRRKGRGEAEEGEDGETKEPRYWWAGPRKLDPREGTAGRAYLMLRHRQRNIADWDVEGSRARMV